MNSLLSTPSSNPQPQRLRHTVQFRTLDVLRTQLLGPRMRRITLGGPELAGFVSAAPDDHIKLFFTPPGTPPAPKPVMGPQGVVFPEGVARPPMRDYTPRRYDASAGVLDIDFVLHGDGPAATWAAAAVPGDRILAGGPRGSLIVPYAYEAFVLIGDETALPAIGRWLEEMPAGIRVDVYAEIAESADRLALSTRADLHLHWLERRGVPAGTASLLLDALRTADLPGNEGYFWTATESTQARAVRQYLLGERGIAESAIHSTGYWKRGVADHHD